jgi:hypothetical protein
MPIPKVTANQFAQQITSGINSRNANLDTAFGPIPDASINPQAAVFENQNDRVVQLSLMLSLANADAFTNFDADLEGIVFNEGMVRILGAGASAILVFARKVAPPIDAVVQQGFPIGSEPDASTGTTVTFVTTESAVLPASTAASFFNIQTQQYELSVPAIAVVSGSVTSVGPNQIDRPLRALGNFDSVTNPAAAQGGRDKETNAELISRYLLAIIGRQTGTPNGISRVALADFADVQSLFVVFGTNTLLTRAATDAGAVDAWIKGSSLLQIMENHVFLGTGQLIQIASPPLVTVVSVSSGATTFVEGSDYAVVFDSSGVSASVRGKDGIQFLPGGPNPLPAVGATVTITYAFDNLIIALQNGFQLPDVLELGRDLLFRRGINVPIVHTAVLTVLQGFSATTVLQNVQTAVLDFINGLGLAAFNPADSSSGSVQGSDIEGVVRTISGVDNYVITRLTRSTVPFGIADIPLGGNEFPTLAQADLSITLG